MFLLIFDSVVIAYEQFRFLVDDDDPLVLQQPVGSALALVAQF